jgi:hypothetical protein
MGWSMSISMFRIEVRNPDAHDAFDNHDLTECRQTPADENVYIFASGTSHLDDAALFERQDFRQLHLSLIELHFDVDGDIPDMGDLL